MPKVLNKRTDGVPDGAVYVGRPTKWGNPFTIGRDGDREAVISMYVDWFGNSPDSPIMDVRELQGKDLVCWCAPEQCHADVLLVEANA